MHELFHAYQLKKSRMETINPVLRHPGYVNTFETRIADSSEDAIKEDKELEGRTDMHLYAVHVPFYLGAIGQRHFAIVLAVYKTTLCMGRNQLG
jgi:hypothetical protein